MRYKSHTNHSAQLYFSTKDDGTALAQRMLIDKNGNVAIGENFSLPSTLLHLKSSNSTIPQFTIEDNSQQLTMTHKGDFNLNANYYRFLYDNNEIVRMAPGGVPGGRVHINVNSTVATWDPPSLESAGAFTIQNTDASNGNYSFWSFADAAGYGIAAMGAVNVNQSTHEGQLIFATKPNKANLEQRMVINETGNIAIGKNFNQPSSLLHLKGTTTPQFTIEGSNSQKLTLSHKGEFNLNANQYSCFIQ